MGRRCSTSTFAPCLPLRDDAEHRATTHARIRRCVACVDRPTRAKVRVPFDARIPSSNRPRTSCRACVRVKRTVAPSASHARTGPMHRVKRDAGTTIGLPFHAIPRRLARSSKTEARSTRLRARYDWRGSLPVSSPERAPFHVAPECPEGTPTLCSKETCAFLTPSRCPV